MEILLVYPGAFFIQAAPLMVYAQQFRPEIHFTHVLFEHLRDTSLPQLPNLSYVFVEADGDATGDYPATRAFETALREAVGVLNGLLLADVQPDLIYADIFRGSLAFLKTLYACPIVGYGEMYANLINGPPLYRPEFDSEIYLGVRANSLMAHAFALQQMVLCDRLVFPTEFQKHSLPPEFWPKTEVIFEGLNLDLHRPPLSPARQIGSYVIPEGKRIVTYASRSLEPVRGFDLFMQAAARVQNQLPDVIFLIAGQSTLHYGIGGGFGPIVPGIPAGQSYKDWVLAQGDYDLERFIFLDFLPMDQLIQLFHLSDVHVYLTIPYMVSWSLFSAMACGCLVLGSRTAPVLELIEDGQTGLLAEFYDPEQIAQQMMIALENPEAYRPLRENAARLITEKYNYLTCSTRLLALFEGLIPCP